MRLNMICLSGGLRGTLASQTSGIPISWGIQIAGRGGDSQGFKAIYNIQEPAGKGV